MKRLRGGRVGLILVAALLLAGCKSVMAPPSPTPEAGVVDIASLAQTLAGMLAGGNTTGAQARLDEARKLDPCALEGYPAYFPTSYDAAKQQQLADNFIEKWLAEHPNGETALATAPLMVSVTTNTPTGPQRATTVGVIVVRDCDEKADS